MLRTSSRSRGRSDRDPPDADRTRPRLGRPASRGAHGSTATVLILVPLLVLASVLAALAAGLPAADSGRGAPLAVLADEARPIQSASGPVGSGSAAPSSGGFRDVLLPAGSPDGVANGTEPAPMGVADLGEVPGGGSDTYDTASFRGTIVLASLATYNVSLGSESSDMSFQLNAYLAFEAGGTNFVYWAQDVFKLNTATGQVSVFDNIWNATSQPLPEIGASAVHGNGSFGAFNVSGFPETYYGDAAPCGKAGACATLDYQPSAPTTVVLRLNASLVAGKPTIRFSFDDGSGMQSFDTATFSPTVVAASFQGLYVNSSALSSTCVRCAGDVELVAGGPDSGYQTSLSGPTNVSLSIQRWNGHDYESIADAYDHGIATAEGLQNASVRVAPGLLGAPAGVLTNAGGTLGSIWGQGSVSTVGITVVGGAGGVLAVDSQNVTFTGTYVELTLLPGTYDLTVVDGTAYPLGNRTLVGGEYLTLEVGGAAVVFVPSGLGSGQVWSVTLGAATLNGTTNITFGETAGTYPFTVGSLSGYAARPGSGTVTVNVSGSNVTVAISWSSTRTSLLAEIGSLLEMKLGPVPVYALVLVLLLLGIVAAVTSRRKRRTVRWGAPPSRPLPPPGEFDFGSMPPEPPHRPPPG